MGENDSVQVIRCPIMLRALLVLCLTTFGIAVLTGLWESMEHQVHYAKFAEPANIHSKKAHHAQ